MKFLKKSIFLFLLLSVGFCSMNLFKIEQERRALKVDQIEINHIKYGLFNVDEWKVILADIVTKKINEFEVTPENRKEILKKTEKLLNKLIDEVDRVYREKNKKSIGGLIKQLFADVFVDMEKIRSGVPEYAEALVDELNKPENKKNIRQMVIDKIDQYADQTVGEMDYTKRDAIFEKHGVDSKESFSLLFHKKSEFLRAEKQLFISGLLIAGILFCFMSFKIQFGDRFEVACFGTGALSLLFSGVMLPMIDIEATIDHFSFLLTGEEVLFENQVLFFQSKSIFEVIQLLVQNGDIGLIIVALLIFSFSVLLPLLKLVSSMICLVKLYAPKTRFFNWIIFYSAKWSMADVIVVALFMAYLGFSGVISGQLSQIERNTGNLEIFTTDNSSLQLGFFLFTAYVLFGLLLSTMLKRAGIKNLSEA